MIRVTVTLLNELEDNSYVAYSEPGNLLEVMTQVYHEVNKRIEDGAEPEVGPSDAVPSFTCEPVVKGPFDESGGGDNEAGPYDSFVGLQRLPKGDA